MIKIKTAEATGPALRSRVRGYYGTYQDALNAVGKRFLRTRAFSIQRSADAKDHPWALIYYGRFVR